MLSESNHPFLMQLKYSFHDETFIYFIMPYVQGGDLFFHLKNEERFPEDRVKFYAA